MMSVIKKFSMDALLLDVGTFDNNINANEKYKKNKYGYSEAK